MVAPSTWETEKKKTYQGFLSTKNIKTKSLWVMENLMLERRLRKLKIKSPNKVDTAKKKHDQMNYYKMTIPITTMNINTPLSGQQGDSVGKGIRHQAQ